MSSGRLYLYHLVAFFLPSTRFFSVKRYLLRWAGARVGANVRIVSSAKFHLTGSLEIGGGAWIGHEVMIVGGAANVKIGANVDIGPRVLMVTGSHRLYTLPEKAAGPGYSSPIHIEDGAWIGASATILGGVTVGEKSVVAAGALVRSDIPKHEIHAGVPNAAIIKDCQVC